MRSISDNVLQMIPPVVAVGLIAAFAVPTAASGWPLAPNVGFVMTLVMVTLLPAAWPRVVVFALGLFQDVLCNTPLGSQALLMLLLAEVTALQTRRVAFQQFRMRWLEAAGMLLAAHLLLWVAMYGVLPEAPPLRMVLRTGVMSALWYPLFYGVVARMVRPAF